MTLRCKLCAAENEDDYLFCLNCGTPFVRTCRICGNRVEGGQKFCTECGTKVAPHEPPQPKLSFCPECGFPTKGAHSFCIQCGSRLCWPEPSEAGAAPAEEPFPTPNTVTKPNLPADPVPAAVVEPEPAIERTPEPEVAVEQEPEPEPEPQPEIVPDQEPEPAAEAEAEPEEEPAANMPPCDDATTVLASGPRPVLTRVKTGEAFALFLPETVGKGSDATCRIEGNSAISRCHAFINSSSGPLGTVFTIEDLGSTNKTSVDGVALVPGEHRTLTNGCTITMADEVFIFSVMTEDALIISE